LEENNFYHLNTAFPFRKLILLFGFVPCSLRDDQPLNPFSPGALLPNHIPNQLKLSISPLGFHMYPMTVKDGIGNTLHDAINLRPKFGKKASFCVFSSSLAHD
jgi:hypothetical protein